MRISLGIHVKHDRGACIIIDRKVVVNIANERIDRIKHSSSYMIPFEAIDAVLNYCNITIDKVSCIGLSGAGLESEKVKQFYKDELFSHYNCSDIPFFFVSHHLAHACSAYYLSGFENSLIFVADGGGDYIGNKQEAETLYLGNKGKIQQLSARYQNLVIRKMENPVNNIYPFMPDFIKDHQISLARKYSQITHLLGFGFGEEGKTMGLASYGTSYFDYTKINYHNLDFSLKYKDAIEDINTKYILSGLSHKLFIDAERHNIAATIQKFIEYSLSSLLRNFQSRYQCTNLCLAGGIFLNCLANYRIIKETTYENVFILPAAGDDGQALGSAYYAYNELFGDSYSYKIQLPYIGLEYSDKEIETSINNKNLKYNKYSDEDLAKAIADYISDNKIIGLHRGKTELGPRALCHRSILANPSNPNMKDILNKRVKHREEFRPFAPTVLAEKQFEYFDLVTSSEFMLQAPTVKEKYRKLLPSITHIDNTARVQAITKENDYFMHCLLMELEKRIGAAVVLNTSFNVAGQPIVETPLDALNTFLSTNIDVLVIGNYIIIKK